MTVCRILGLYAKKAKGRISIFLYAIQHCFICRPSDSTVSEDAGIEPALTARLDLIHESQAKTEIIFKSSTHTLYSLGLCRQLGDQYLMLRPLKEVNIYGLLTEDLVGILAKYQYREPKMLKIYHSVFFL
jgi:hypothetical protein